MTLCVGRWMELFSKMGATAMSEKGFQMNVSPIGGGKLDVHQSEAIIQSLNNWDHYVIRRYHCGPRASNPSSLSRLHLLASAERHPDSLRYVTPSAPKSWLGDERMCSSFKACQTSSQRGWAVQNTFTLSFNHFWNWKGPAEKTSSCLRVQAFLFFCTVCSL